MSGAAAAASSAGKRVWTFSHSSASHASAQFCPDCQSILDLPDADLILRCPTCAFQLRFRAENASYEKLSISTKYSATGGGMGGANDDGEQPMVAAFTRAKVKERCPQCQNPEMSFYTVR
jgi:DNA-directed RNA polymerase subunit M/transcription elongation factor TFIIS